MQAVKLWVYIDSDHDDVELFTTLRSAKQHAEQNWPKEDDDMKWEKCGKDAYSWGEYVRVVSRSVDL